MTDAELLALLQEKSPREFTAAEIAALREGWPQSAEVRQALLEQVQLETDLATGLADVTLTVDQLLARAQRRPRSTRGGTARRWWLLAGLVVALIVATQWPFDGSQNAEVPVATDDQPAPATVPPGATPDQPATPPATTPEPIAAVAATPTPQPSTPAPITPPTEAPPTALLAERFPWSPALLPEAQPAQLGSPQLLGDLKTIGHDELSLEEFRKWWAEVPGQPSNWNQQVVNNRRTVQMQGAARLRAPWLQDTWLRLTPFDVQELTLLFWTGDRGIALQFYKHREPHLWAAFAVERSAGSAWPDRWGLLSTDSGAVYRSGVATLELHHHDGSLVLSVAQTPVLSVPLAQPPTDVVLMGHTRWRGVSWLRAEPLPQRTAREHHVVWSTSGAEPTAWEGLPEGQPPLTRAADGSVSLQAASSKDYVIGWTKLPQPGLFEVRLQVMSGDPGTGVMLGDATGKPVALVGLLKERRTGQLTLAGLRPGERRVESDYDFKAFPPPYVTLGQWIRVVAGLGALQISVSGDGVQWGQVVESPLRDVRGAIQSVGLFAQPSESPRQITLSQLEVRQLDQVTAVANAAQLAALTIDVAKLPRDLQGWQQAALRQHPAALPVADWLDTYALATLQAGPPPELVAPLVGRLADSLLARPWPAAQRWRTLDDLLEVTDHWPERDAVEWTNRYAMVATASDGASVRAAWAAWLQSPLWTHGSQRDPFHRALSEELLAAAEQGRSDEVDRLSRFALHTIATPHPDHPPRDAARQLEQIARWARGQSGVARRDQSDEVFPPTWRHPYQTQLDKDAYNTRAELQSALDSAAYRDAARIALSLGETAPSGLLPDVREPNLFVSLPVALAGAWRDYPAFAETMRQEFTEVGRLRVQQAAARADVEALRTATLQFFGTAAAAEAQAWLGDRHMALGEFPAAWRRYEQAVASGDAEQQTRIAPRLELARRLTGPLPGAKSAASSAALTLNGQDLVSVIQELQPTAPVFSADVLSTPAVALSPQRYKLQPRARFDGQAGHNAGQGEFKSTDAFGRQFGVAADDRHLYVSNRFQVTAYDRQGQSKWAVAVGSEQGNAHAHRFTPMTPLVVNTALYVRRLTKAGIELARLDADNGNVRWHVRPGDRANWLSDPVWTADGLWALAAHKVDDDWLDLRWSRVQAETGELLAEVPLLRLRDAWQSEVPCRVTVQGWNAVAVVGGTVLSFTLNGELQWLRQETWLPTKLDPLAEQYVLAAPLLSERDVLISQPGSRTVRCLDLATGKTLWQHVSPTLQGLLGATASRVILAELDVLTACDRATGATVWSQPIDGRLTACSVSADTVLVARGLPFKGNRGWLQLVWIDAQTGEVRAEAPVDADAREEWRFGPWFTVGDKTWAFAGQTWRDPHRDLVELVPIADSSVGPWHHPALGAWQSALAADERRAVQIVLPGWSPFASARDALSIASGEVRGRTPVLVARVKKDDALQFLRQITVPRQGLVNLHLRAGHQPGQSWRLQVRVEDQLIVDQKVEDASSTNGWVEHTVPLSFYAGRSVLVQVAQHGEGDKASEGLWHQLAIQSQ